MKLVNKIFLICISVAMVFTTILIYIKENRIGWGFLAFEIIVILLVLFLNFRISELRKDYIEIKRIFFGNVLFRKQEVDYLRFRTSNSGRSGGPSLSVFVKGKKLLIKEALGREETQEIYNFLKSNDYQVKFKGDFYWLIK